MSRRASLIWLAAAACSTTSTPSGTASWTTQTLPGPREEAGVTTLGTQLVIAGGFDSPTDVTSEVDVLDTLTSAWTQLPAMPVAWSHVQLVGLDGSLYLLGGLDGTALTPNGESFVLDPGAASWRQVFGIPAGFERGSAGVIVAPPRIYLIGGVGAAGPLASCIYYDVFNDSWSTSDIPDLPSARSHVAGMRRDDGALIVAGGRASADASQPIAETDILTVTATSWDVAMAMPESRGGCAYAEVSGQLLCAGGETATAASTEVDSFDPNTSMWTVAPPLPTPRAGATGAAVGETFYVVGGAPTLDLAPTADMAVFSAL